MFATLTQKETVNNPSEHSRVQLMPQMRQTPFRGSCSAQRAELARQAWHSRPEPASPPSSHGAWNAKGSTTLDRYSGSNLCDDNSDSSSSSWNLARDLASVQSQTPPRIPRPLTDTKTIHNYEHQCPHPPARPVHHDNHQRIIIPPSQADDHDNTHQISQVNPNHHQIKCHM